MKSDRGLRQPAQRVRLGIRTTPGNDAVIGAAAEQSTAVPNPNLRA
jgi:hypothetical protein